MSMTTPLTRMFGITHPIVQAPMAGGPTTPEMVAAVANAGALGSFAGAMQSPETIRAGIAATRALTDRPFSANLFVLDEHQPQPSADELATALARLAPIRAELGLPPGSVPARFSERTEEQIEVLIEARIPIVSFTFGLLPATTVERLHRAGALVMGTATTVAEARAWRDVGADVICAQGSEAGAHRGSWLGDPEQSLIGLVALVPQIVDAVDLPVVAAGGIMDGRGIAAALCLGAGAAQLGTAFLSCPEAGTSPPYRAALRGAADDSTTVTRTITGRHARGIRNRFINELAVVEAEIPAYPVQNALTGEIRRVAAAAGRAEYLSLWAGQGVGLLRDLPAGELVAALVAELAAARGG